MTTAGFGLPPRNGWFRSGDRGFIDTAGKLTISGRSKDMIIHGGANIWPREIEETLVKHPDVADVAVVGIHDDYFGENTCACVIPRTGTSPTLEDLIAFMKDDVAKYKLPSTLSCSSPSTFRTHEITSLCATNSDLNTRQSVGASDLHGAAHEHGLAGQGLTSGGQPAGASGL